MIGHIIERFIIHFVASAGVYLMVYFGSRWAERKWPRKYDIAIPAILVVAFIGWNEVFNLWQGQPFIKAVTDGASWLLGLGVSVWGLVRFRNE